MVLRRRLRAFVFALLLLPLFSQQIAAQTSPPASHKTIEWYRSSGAKLPQAQFSVAPDAIDKTIFSRLKARALLAQIKYELANGAYWTISKTERDQLISVLDDSKTRFVYSGRKSRARAAAAGQVSDENTIDLHHAAFVIRTGPYQGSFRTQFRIAGVMLRYAVHANQLRRLGQMHVFNPRKDDHPKAVELQFRKAKARFSSRLIEELAEYVANPAAYGKTAAPAAGGVPRRPSYDPSGLKRADAALSRLQQNMQNLQARVQSACKELGSARQIDARVKALQTSTLSGLTPSEKAQQQILNSGKAKLARLQALQNRLAKLEKSTVKAGERVCSLSKRARPDMNAVKAPAEAARNAAVLAGTVMQEAKELNSGFTAALKAESKTPSQQEQANEAERLGLSAYYACLKDDIGGVLNEASRPESLQEFNRWLAFAKQSLIQADKAGFAQTDFYRQRFNRYQYKAPAIRKGTAFNSCVASSTHLRAKCGQLRGAVVQTAARKLKARQDAQASFRAKRTRQADRMRSTAEAMKQMKERIVAGAALSGTCAGQAEAKSREWEATIREAAGLADARGLQCTAEAFDTRIAALKAEKFKGVEAAARGLNQLNAKRGVVLAETTRIDTSGELIAEGKTAAAERQMRKARAALAQLKGAPRCAALEARLDKLQREADQSKDLLQRAQSSLAGCDAARARSAIDAIDDAAGASGLSPQLKAARGRLAVRLSVHSVFAQAISAITNGDLAAAGELLSTAKTRNRRAGGKACRTLAAQIDLVSARLGQLRAAAKSCDRARLKTLEKVTAKLPDALANPLKEQAERVAEICRSTASAAELAEAERAVTSCTPEALNRANLALAGKTDAAALTMKARIGAALKRCGGPPAIKPCDPGSERDASGACRKIKPAPAQTPVKTPVQTPAKTPAEISAHCLNTHGAGHDTGRLDSSGNIICLPSQAFADTWCNTNNPGEGWTAHDITGVNRFRCSKPRDKIQAEAEQACRRQAAQQGRVYARTQMHQDNRYTCYSCPGGQVFRDSRCYTQRQLAEADCRALAQRDGKVYTLTPKDTGGAYECNLCNPGQTFSNGACINLPPKAPLSCPYGYVLRGANCYPADPDDGPEPLADDYGDEPRYACTFGNPDDFFDTGSSSTVYSREPIPGADCRLIE